MKGTIFRRISACLAAAVMTAGLCQPAYASGGEVSMLPAETLAPDLGQTEAGRVQGEDPSAANSGSSTEELTASAAGSISTKRLTESSPGGESAAEKAGITEKETSTEGLLQRPDLPLAGIGADKEASSEKASEAFPEAAELYLTEYTESEKDDLPEDEAENITGEMPEEEPLQTETETESASYKVTFEEAEGCSIELKDDKDEYAPGQEVIAIITALPEHAIDEVSAEYEGQLATANATNVTDYATGNDQDQVHFQAEDLTASAETISRNQDETTYELGQELTAAKKVTFNMPRANVVMRAKSHKIDIPGVSSFTLASAYSDETTLGETRFVNYIDDGQIKSTNVTMTNTFAKLGDNENSTAMKVVDFKDANGNVVFSSLAYCLQPDKVAPENSAIKDSNIMPLDTSGSEDRRIYKAMYYMYRGPAWGDTIGGINMKTLIKSLGFTKLDGSDPGNAQYYNVTHFVLAASYDPENWNKSSAKGHFFNAQGVKAIQTLLNTIDSLPEPQTALSAAEVGSSSERGAVYSDPITFQTSMPSNWAKFTLPAGFGLLITDTGARIEPAGQAQTATVLANQTFRVINTTGSEGSQHFDITTRYASEYDPFKIKTVPTQQNISFSYMASTGLSFNVDWKNPTYGAIRIRKADSQAGFAYAQGDGTLEGAVFQIISNSDSPVYLSADPATPHEKGSVLAEITTDGSGLAATPASFLTSGAAYIVREKSPGKAGYRLLQKDIPVTVPAGKDTIADLSYDPSLIPEQVMTGGISVQKCDWYLADGPEGSASLDGAEFSVTNISKSPVIVGGNEIKPGSVACVLKTDSKGYASSGPVLPYGTYEVKETKAPEGYLIGSGKASVSVHEDGKIIAAAPADSSRAGVWIERPVLFDIKLEKFRDYAQNDDSISDTLIPLEGAKFDIISMNEHPVHVAGKDYSSGQTVATLVTDSKGVASTRSIEDNIPGGTLPYGRYRIHESDSPEGLNKIEDFEVNGTAQGGVTDGMEFTGICKNDRPIETPIQIMKQDAETGQVIGIAGTSFQILESDDKTPHVFQAVGSDGIMKKISEFTVSESGTVTLPNKLGYGTWYIHETKAPLGYVLPGEDMKFEVSRLRKWGDYQIETLKDDPQKFKIRIQKTNLLTGQSLAGAVFSVTAAEDIITGDGTVRIRKGEVADTVTIGEDGTGQSCPLYLGVIRDKSEEGTENLTLRGQYDVTEISAPQGFTRNPDPIRVCAVSPDQVTEIFELDPLKVENPPTTLKLFKHDPSGKGIGGIEFEMKRIGGDEASGAPFDGTCGGGKFRTDDDGNLVVSYILPGIYSLRETKTLPGYIPDMAIQYFTVDKDGYIFKSDSEGKQTDDMRKSSQLSLDWVNDVTKVEISKKDITDSKEVMGATLVIRDESGQQIDQWVTDGTPHYVEKLPAGSYTLTEITAPSGYQQAETVPFTVEETGEIQKVFMYDAPVETEPQTQSESETGTEKESESETQVPETVVEETNPHQPQPQAPSVQPKTGDNTDLRTLVLGVIAGILLLVGAFLTRISGRRKGRG